MFGTGALETASLDAGAPWTRRYPRGRWRLRRQGPLGPLAADRPSPLPFTPRAKQALERSLRLALKAGSGRIEAEHVGVALLDMKASSVPLLLAELGVSHESVRQALRSRRAG